MAPFPIAKLRRMNTSAPARLRPRVKHVVQHLMVDDELHKVLRHIWRIQGRVNADEGVAPIITAKYNMPTAPPAGFHGPTAPSDVYFKLTTKKLLVHIPGESVQIILLPARPQRNRLSRGRFFPVGIAMGIHILAQDGGAARQLGPRNVLRQGISHLRRGSEEHLVHTEAHRRAVSGAGKAKQGTAVIVDTQMNAPPGMGFEVPEQPCGLLAIYPRRTSEARGVFFTVSGHAGFYYACRKRAFSPVVSAPFSSGIWPANRPISRA